jgi:hypothetical protein
MPASFQFGGGLADIGLSSCQCSEAFMDKKQIHKALHRAVLFHSTVKVSRAAAFLPLGKDLKWSR